MKNKDLTYTDIEVKLVTIQANLQGIKSSLEILQNYLDNDSQNELAKTSNSMLDIIISRAGLIIDEQENLISVLNK